MSMEILNESHVCKLTSGSYVLLFIILFLRIGWWVRLLNIFEKGEPTRKYSYSTSVFTNAIQII